MPGHDTRPLMKSSAVYPNTSVTLSDTISTGHSPGATRQRKRTTGPRLTIACSVSSRAMLAFSAAVLSSTLSSSSVAMLRSACSVCLRSVMSLTMWTAPRSAPFGSIKGSTTARYHRPFSASSIDSRLRLSFMRVTGHPGIGCCVPCTIL